MRAAESAPPQANLAETEELRAIVSGKSTQQEQKADLLRMDVQKLKQELTMAQEAAQSYGPQQIAALSKECVRLKQDLKAAAEGATKAKEASTLSSRQLKEELLASNQERDKLAAELSQQWAASSIKEIQDSGGQVRVLHPGKCFCCDASGQRPLCASQLLDLEPWILHRVHDQQSPVCST